MRLVAFRMPGELLSFIDAWRARYPGMDRSAALRCLIGLGLGRRTAFPKRTSAAPASAIGFRCPARVRDPGSEGSDGWHRKNWIWYRVGEPPERVAPWGNNASNWGTHARKRGAGAAAGHRLLDLHSVKAAAEFCTRRGEEPTAEAIAALLGMDEVKVAALLADLRGLGLYAEVSEDAPPSTG
jgi:hypothetical protein